MGPMDARHRILFVEHELARWIEAFERDLRAAAIDWRYEMRKGIDESLRDFL